MVPADRSIDPTTPREESPVSFYKSNFDNPDHTRKIFCEYLKNDIAL